MQRDLINISVPRYGTRMLRAGDTFSAARGDAAAFVAMKKARYASGSDAPQPAQKQVTDIEALRAAYHKATGKKAFNGWDAETLTKKIAAAGKA